MASGSGFAIQQRVGSHLPGSAESKPVQIFVQIFLISLVNAATAAVWVFTTLMGFDGVWVNYASVIGAILCHAVPPYIYLTLNATIRSEVLAMFLGNPSPSNTSAPPTLGAVTVMVQPSLKLLQSAPRH